MSLYQAVSARIRSYQPERIKLRRWRRSLGLKHAIGPTWRRRSRTSRRRSRRKRTCVPRNTTTTSPPRTKWRRPSRRWRRPLTRWRRGPRGPSLNWKVRYRSLLRFFSQMIKLYRARALLYRRQSLQENIRWKALDEIYKICMFLHRSDLNISEKNRQTFSYFSANFAKFSHFRKKFIEFY